MKKWIEIEGEEVCMKKDFYSWRVIYPLKNKDGILNWKNIIIGGSFGNLIKLIIYVLVLLFLIWTYKTEIGFCKELINCGAKCPNILNYPIIP